ncbi:MAG: allantoinase AllB [Chloroflexota bacterium]
MMNKPTLYLKNGQIVTEETTFHGGIVVEQDKIVQLVAGVPNIEADETLDVDGKVVLPGLVDDHVHFNEPGREHLEGYETGSKAAAAGGITTFLEMPLNASPPTIDALQFERKREAVKGKSVVDYGFWGGLVDNNLDKLDELNAKGVVAFKAFLSDSGSDFARIDDDLLYAGLMKMAEYGNLLAVHAESNDVTRFLAEQLQAQGRHDMMAWPESRPPFTELEAIHRSLYWAGVTGGQLHIVHISIASGIEAVVEAKTAGINVTAETCPQYLCFDHQDYVRIGPKAKCAPPIRSRDDVEALWGCVLAGKIDVIASDHSPCLREEKTKGKESIWQAWGGISGVQVMLPALLTEGVHKRNLPLPLLAKMMCTNPARIFGLYPRKGAIVPGADADFTVVDLDKEWTLSADQLFQKHKHSAFEGYQFKGAIERTIVRGQTVYRHGEVVGMPGYGTLL